jgi:hypothetical protein
MSAKALACFSSSPKARYDATDDGPYGPGGGLITTHFINTLQAYGVVLELVIGRSDAMLAYKANVLDGLYE